jgi:hypothetical protein
VEVDSVGNRNDCLTLFTIRRTGFMYRGRDLVGGGVVSLYLPAVNLSKVGPLEVLLPET